MLTQPGIDVAIQMNVAVYLEATDRAVRLYEKLGFEKLDKGVVLSPELHGGNETIEAPVMVKMPSGGTGTCTSFDTWIKEAEN